MKFLVDGYNKEQDHLKIFLNFIFLRNYKFVNMYIEINVNAFVLPTIKKLTYNSLCVDERTLYTNNWSFEPDLASCTTALLE